MEDDAGTRRIWSPYDAEALGGAPAGVALDVWDGEGPPPDTAAEVEMYVVPYLFSRHTLLLMREMPRLRVVQTLTAGVEHVRPYLPKGVTLCNARGLHDTSTAELAVTLALTDVNGIPRFLTAQREHRWDFHQRGALADRTVLIVGYGAIGHAIAARLAPFEVDLLKVARHARPDEGVASLDELPALLGRADVVVLCVPGTRETRGMVDRHFLARMKDGALLVNVSRGSVVDTDALLAELRTGRLRAAVDVTEPEPLPPEHPLWDAPGLVLTPHVGGHSTAFLPRALRLVRDQVGRFATGEPLANVVTGDY